MIICNCSKHKPGLENNNLSLFLFIVLQSQLLQAQVNFIVSLPIDQISAGGGCLIFLFLFFWMKIINIFILCCSNLLLFFNQAARPLEFLFLTMNHLKQKQVKY